MPRSPLGDSPFGVAVSPDGTSVYVTNFAGSSVSQYTVGADGALIAKTPATVAAGDARGVAVLPDQGPVASFSATVAPAGAATRFDASASGDPDGSIARYDWDFGDGSVSADAGPAPAHGYAAGTYTVRLTVTDTSGCSTRFVFTGQTASCAGRPAATTTRTITVAPGRRPPPPAGCGKSTSKVSLARATFDRSARTISILAPITRHASGTVQVTLRAAGRTTRFDAPIDRRNGRVRVTRPISAAQARLGSGIITITYPGDSDTRAQSVRLRAANTPAALRVTRPRITARGFLRAGGRVSTKARGVVHIQLEYVDRRRRPDRHAQAVSADHPRALADQQQTLPGPAQPDPTALRHRALLHLLHRVPPPATTRRTARATSSGKPLTTANACVATRSGIIVLTLGAVVVSGARP